MRLWGDWHCPFRGCSATRKARTIGSPMCPRHNVPMLRPPKPRRAALRRHLRAVGLA